MRCNRYLIITVFFFGCMDAIKGQFRLPIFDAELKIHQNLFPGNGQFNGDLEVLETTNLYGGAHVQLNQYIAIGAFYSRSFRGVSQVRYNEGHQRYDALFLQKGLDVRFSTSRAKKWRKYLIIQYSGVEIVQDKEVYRLGGKTKTFGGSVGVMRRLSNNLYLNVFELGVNVLSDKIFWFGNSPSNFYLNAKMGLSYNIGKRK